MKQKTTNNLIKASNVFFQKDEDGLPELTPKAAMAALIVISILFGAVSVWAR